MFIKKYKKSIGLIVFFFLFLEVGLRVAGLTDYPIYVVDDKIGYYPKPSQSGNFKRNIKWKVNEESLLADKFNPNVRTDILIIGDSIVSGGNLIDDSKRLGANLRLEGKGDWSVWPAGAGGWSVMNEVAFLEAHENVISKVDWLVWVLNSSDFTGPSLWESDRTHPRRHPLIASWYLFDKYILAKYIEPKFSFFRKPMLNPEISFQPTDFAFDTFDEYHKQLVIKHPKIKCAIVWYPDVAEVGRNLPFWDNLTERLEKYTKESNILLINIHNDSRWNATFYRDQIHPTEDGNAMLAKIIADRILEANKVNK